MKKAKPVKVKTLVRPLTITKIKVTLKRNFQIEEYKHCHVEVGMEAELNTTVTEGVKQLTAIVEKELTRRIKHLECKYDRDPRDYYDHPF